MVSIKVFPTVNIKLIWYSVEGLGNMQIFLRQKWIWIPYSNNHHQKQSQCLTDHIWKAEMLWIDG
jgi:hypothetical protein